MTIFLQTPRLILKIPNLSDIDNLCLLQTNREVMRYIGRGIRTRPQIQEGLRMALQHYAKHGFSLGAVYEKETNQYVGRSGLIYLGYDDTQPDIEIGYALLEPYWGKGYATELSIAMIKWGFTNLQVGKLVGIINPANDKSRRVLEKAGMHFISKEKYHDLPVERFEITREQFSS